MASPRRGRGQEVGGLGRPRAGADGGVPCGPRRGGVEDARIWRVGFVSSINRGPSAMLERIYAGWAIMRRGFVLLGLLVCTLLWAISVLLLWVFFRLRPFSSRHASEHLFSIRFSCSQPPLQRCGTNDRALGQRPDAFPCVCALLGLPWFAAPDLFRLRSDSCLLAFTARFQHSQDIADAVRPG